jgi:hypothetical protein
MRRLDRWSPHRPTLWARRFAVEQTALESPNRSARRGWDFRNLPHRSFSPDGSSLSARSSGGQSALRVTYSRASSSRSSPPDPDIRSEDASTLFPHLPLTQFSISTSDDSQGGFPPYIPHSGMISHAFPRQRQSSVRPVRVLPIRRMGLRVPHSGFHPHPSPIRFDSFRSVPFPPFAYSRSSIPHPSDLQEKLAPRKLKRASIRYAILRTVPFPESHRCTHVPFWSRLLPSARTIALRVPFPRHQNHPSRRE